MIHGGIVGRVERKQYMPKTDHKLLPKLYDLSKKQTLVLGIIVLAVIFGIFIAWQTYGSKQNKGDSTGTKVTEKIDVQVRKDSASGDYSASSKALESAPQTEEYDLLRITLYRNKGDNQSALAVYERLLTKKSNDLGLVLGAAETAEAAGDKAKAIQYYQQAKKIESGIESPVKDANISNYDLKIKELGGQ